MPFTRGDVGIRVTFPLTWGLFGVSVPELALSPFRAPAEYGPLRLFVADWGSGGPRTKGGRSGAYQAAMNPRSRGPRGRSGGPSHRSVRVQRLHHVHRRDRGSGQPRHHRRDQRRPPLGKPWSVASSTSSEPCCCLLRVDLCSWSRQRILWAAQARCARTAPSSLQGVPPPRARPRFR